MCFIMLTDVTGADRMVNAADIVTATTYPTGTRINLRHGDLNWFTVKQTPVEIFRIIEQASQK